MKRSRHPATAGPRGGGKTDRAQRASCQRDHILNFFLDILKKVTKLFKKTGKEVLIFLFY
jgi:hypothetical protein